MKEKKNVVVSRLDLGKLKIARNVLRAVNHKLRQHILDLLNEQGEMNVTDLWVRLRLEQSIVSQHLAIMLKAGIVNIRRQGRFIFYSVNYDAIKKINQIVKEISAERTTMYWRLRELYTPFFATCNIDIFI